MVNVAWWTLLFGLAAGWHWLWRSVNYEPTRAVGWLSITFFLASASSFGLSFWISR
jgi:hypothetical protein